MPVAYIIPAAGKSPTADALIAHCRAHLAAYKAPRRVVFKDAFPLGPTGKILKKELRAMLLSELVPVTGNSDIHQEKVLHS